MQLRRISTGTVKLKHNKRQDTATETAGEPAQVYKNNFESNLFPKENQSPQNDRRQSFMESFNIKMKGVQNSMEERNDIFGIKSLAPKSLEQFVNQSQMTQSSQNSHKTTKRRHTASVIQVTRTQKMIEPKQLSASYWGYPPEDPQPVHNLIENRNYLTEYIPNLNDELDSYSLISQRYNANFVGFKAEIKMPNVHFTFRKKAKSVHQPELYQLFQQRQIENSQNQHDPKQDLRKKLNQIKIQRKIPCVVEQIQNGKQLALNTYLNKVRHLQRYELSESIQEIYDCSNKSAEQIVQDHELDRQLENLKRLKQLRIIQRIPYEMSEEEKQFQQELQDNMNKLQRQIDMANRLKRTRQMIEQGKIFVKTLKSPEHVKKQIKTNVAQCETQLESMKDQNPKTYATTLIKIEKGNKPLVKSTHDAGTQILLESQVGQKINEVKKHMKGMQYQGGYIGNDKSIQKAIEILKNRSYVQMKQQIGMANAEDLYQKDSNYQFQKVIQNTEIQVSGPPKIRSGVLILKDVQAEYKLCEAIKQYLLYSTNEKLQCFLVQNSDFDDAMMSLILQALQVHKHLESIIIRGTCFEQECLSNLKPILSIPCNLKELKLVGCQSTKYVVEELVEYFVEEDCRLESIALVKTDVSAKVLNTIAKMIQESQYLVELDLSWNDVNSKDFKPLLEALGNSKKLKNVNLSWNSLIDTCDQKEKPVFECNKLVTGFESVALLLNLQSNTFKNESHKDMVSRCLSNLIRRNPNIQHVNIENCNLGEQCIIDLVQAVKRSKSLQALHFGYNPGITPETVAFWKKQIRFKNQKDSIVLNIRNNQLDTSRPEMYQQLLDENNELDFLASTKETYCMQEIEVINVGGKTMTINRMLGQKKEMPGMAQWSLSDKLDQKQCHICGFWQLTLFYWSKQIGETVEKQQLQITKDQRQRFLNLIHSQVPNLKQEPVVYSESNNYQGYCMIKIHAYLDNLYGRIPTYKQEAKKYAEDLDFQGLSKKKIEEMVQKFIIENQLGVMTERRQNWVQLIQDKIQQPNVVKINQELVTNIDEAYIVMVWLPPGKNNLLIEFEGQSYYQRKVVDVRRDRIAPFKKPLKKNQIERQFFKPRSQFAKWQEDNQQIIQDCLNHDLKLCKFSRFIKSPNEILEVIDIVRSNFAVLKEIFIALVANGSQFPRITQIQFNEFCKISGILDEDAVKQVTIDIAWKATNYSENDQGDQEEALLSRYEFIEILVRLAQQKYLVSGKVTQEAHATQAFIQECIIPMQNKIHSWQKFRHEEMWNLEINDCLEANQKGLTKLFKQYAFLDKSKNIKYDTIVDILFQDLKGSLQLSYRQIQTGYTLSKMTVADDTGQEDLYYEMNYCEFLEMLCRFAVIKFDGTAQLRSWSLLDRLEIILESVLKVIKCKFIRVNLGDLLQTESDADY